MSDLESQAPRLPGEGYSEEEIGRGLQAVAMHSGNTRRAARHLEKCGHPIPRTTLKKWLTTRADEYERARVFVRDRVWDQLAEEHQAVARQALRATEKAIELTTEKVAEKDTKGAAAAASTARNLSTVSGISNDKAFSAHGKDAQIPLARGLAEITAGLARLGVVDRFPIEGELVEEVDVP